jgi:hypothetical protein
VTAVVSLPGCRVNPVHPETIDNDEAPDVSLMAWWRRFHEGFWCYEGFMAR